MVRRLLPRPKLLKRPVRNHTSLVGGQGSKQRPLSGCCEGSSWDRNGVGNCRAEARPIPVIGRTCAAARKRTRGDDHPPNV